MLVDTAIVGHLGRSQLAALGIAAFVLSGLFAIFNFLQYATTAQVARAGGAGESEAAARLGAQALWLSLAFGPGVAALVAALAEPIVSLMGGEGQTADYAVTYLRIASLGLPAAFLALGGQGYLRGVADLRTPLLILVAGNVLNVVLELLFVYGFDWGIEGSAWGTAIAQLAMGAAFVVAVLRRATRAYVRPRPALALPAALGRPLDLRAHGRADELVRARGGRGGAVRRRGAGRPPDRLPALDLPRARARRGRDRRPDHRRARARRGGGRSAPTTRARA